MRKFSLLAYGISLLMLTACGGSLARVPLQQTSALHRDVGPAGPPLSIGSFNLARGGLESLQYGSPSMEKGLRHAILVTFPGTAFRFAPALTPAFLQSIKTLIIGVAAGGTTPITPLSSQEQANLINFVKGGGTAVLLADNDLQFQAASDSILNPFGLSSTGVVQGTTATFLNLATDPIRKGIAGTAKQIDTSWPAWFSSIGTSTEVAQLAANGMPAASYFAAGALGSGSGAVVFFSDSSIMVDGLRTSNDRIALLNALALSK